MNDTCSGDTCSGVQPNVRANIHLMLSINDSLGPMYDLLWLDQVDHCCDCDDYWLITAFKN